MACHRFPLVRLRLCALLAAAVLCSCASTQGPLPRIVERPDWGRYFQAQGVEGTMVLLGESRVTARDTGQGRNSGPRLNLPQGLLLAYNPQRAATGYLPASTFKIVNALIALETGVVSGPDELFPWDGVTRDVAAWNRDLTLRQAFAASAVPVFQQIARRIGPQRMAWYVGTLGYGNGDISGEAPDRFWLSGNLRVSALEQVDFLRRLYHGQLPFTAQTMETVEDLMVVERGPGWTLRAKTGWAVKDTPGIGWWVGWLERDGATCKEGPVARSARSTPDGRDKQSVKDRPSAKDSPAIQPGDSKVGGLESQDIGKGEVWFFALNVDIHLPEQLAARQAVVKAILKNTGLLND